MCRLVKYGICNNKFVLVKVCGVTLVCSNCSYPNTDYHWLSIVFSMLGSATHYVALLVFVFALCTGSWFTVFMLVRVDYSAMQLYRVVNVQVGEVWHL